MMLFFPNLPSFESQPRLGGIAPRTFLRKQEATVLQRFTSIKRANKERKPDDKLFCLFYRDHFHGDKKDENEPFLFSYFLYLQLPVAKFLVLWPDEKVLPQLVICSASVGSQSSTEYGLRHSKKDATVSHTISSFILSLLPATVPFYNLLVVFSLPGCAVIIQKTLSC